MTQRLLLVDNRVEDAHVLCASSASGVKALLLDYTSDTFETLKEKVKMLNTSAFTEVGFASHGYFGDSYNFIAQQNIPSTLKNVNATDENLDSWCELKNFMTHLVENYNTRAFYFVMCELCSDPDWIYILNTIEEQVGTMIHATSGKIGCVEMGGNYIMDATGADLKENFFSDEIDCYSGVLSSSDENNKIKKIKIHQKIMKIIILKRMIK